MLQIREVGRESRFSFEFVLSRSTENFVVEHFCAVFQKTSGNGKVNV